ncbi:MAG: phosphotransferase [Chloroflexota bacterium]|nr:phosphotransferase [Chloroflexota bacterium]
MLADQLLKAYALSPPVIPFALPAVGINNIVRGLHTGNGDLVLKTYTANLDVRTIRAEHHLLHWLQTQRLSFAVPVPLTTRSGDTIYPAPEGYHALFPRLAGHPPQPDNLQHMEAVGSALGELHRTLEAYTAPSAHMPSSYGELNQVHPQVAQPAELTPEHLGLRGTRAEHEVCQWWRDQVLCMHEFLAITYPALPHQFIHGDFAPSNTLIADGVITAILDFEFATYDVRAIDVAAGLKFSMRTWEHDEPWPVGAALCSGYKEWIQLTDAEVQNLPELLRLRDMVAAIWWLGRTIAAGQTPNLERIRDVQVLTGWVEDHAERIQTMLMHGRI